MAYRYEQFAAARRQMQGIVLSPDGQEAAYCVDTSGQFNVWRQSIGGGWPYQLTLFDDWAARFVSWSPRGDLIAVGADKDGAERFQIFLVPVAGGAAEPMTDRLDVQYSLTQGAFSPDGTKLLYSGNELTPTSNDVFVRDLALGVTQTLAEGMGYALGVNWSPDSRSVLVVQVKSNADIDIHVVDVESGSRRVMTEHEGDAINMPGPWLPDGSGFYLISDVDREFKGLALCRVDNAALEWVATPDWDVEAVDLSPDGRVLIYSVNENGLSRIYVRRDGGAEEPVEGLPAGALEDLALAPDGNKAIIQLNSATRGTDIFRVDLDGGNVEQITFGLLGGIPPQAFIEPQVVEYTSFDGRRIPALLFKPDTTEGGKIPAVLSIHGGPESQERPEYRHNGLYQYLAYRGVAVLAPNIRGSTGYGKSYQRLIYHDWGGDDLKDMDHGAQFLLQQEWVDPDRLGVFGGSYGGFATLSCVTRLPQYWAAGAELVGPSNLVTFASAVPPTWKQFIAELLGDPETEAGFLLERSPITYVDQIRCPLLVIQGANDYRVVKAESDQMVERIRARGGMVDYIVLADEGHMFTRRTNQIEAFRAVAEFFLDRFGLSNLVPEDVTPAATATA